MEPNTLRSGFSVRHFVCNYMHKLKTECHIRIFYLSNDCFTIRDIYSLGWSCMWVTIGKLWIQTRIATTFRYDILCVLTLVTRQLQVVCGRCTCRITALLSETSIFYVGAGCEIRMASYSFKLTGSIEEMGNPFSKNSSDLLVLDSSNFAKVALVDMVS